MLRKIIRIDEEKCNGCGLCVSACHEGALGLVGGKAKLLREDYCDGLGDCLPECPTGAISFEEREAPVYTRPGTGEASVHPHPTFANFPIQIKLVSPDAPRFSNCHLVVAADCTAFVCPDFKTRFANEKDGKAVMIGCPKLDGIDYSEKLAEIIEAGGVQSVTVLRMEVPCCGGLVRMAEAAIQKSGKAVPLQVTTIQVNGDAR